ncbi:MAG TPA: DUF748 domain-containing protein [Burkholderiales bacterium]|nr:DUF748 domain-containing protein [Burkholderiales bacterium]
MRKPLLLLSVTVLVLVGLYAAAGYWLLPGYVRQRLVAEAERLGYPLRLEAVRVDPFRLNVELKGAELAISDEARVIAPRVRADLKLASLLARDFLPRRVSLSGGVVELADSRIQPLQATLTRQPGGYRIASDGALSLQGDLVLAPLRLDAEVSASAVPLAAAQPWVSRLARLELASGLASARGRVRFDSTGSPRFAYEGTLSLKDVVLRGEEAGAAPLASWQSLDGTDVALSLAPNRLQVGEALLQGAAGRLVIGENRRTNLARIGKAGKGEGGAAPFPVALRRLTVRGGRLDFTDLSLEPRFATTIRELSGTVSGLGSDGDDEARVELDGRVDRYGSARIRGVINPFAPRTRTSVTMSFRNLEMKSLTPYTAKFAGYRIESGKLSADLRYRVRDSQLVGDNKLVIDSLVLGEHVESAQAPDLPVELAIALLTDARGRIELGLPVRGDLSDPEFSLTQLAGKVLGNLLERIASAPFRLLGSLLGGGSERDLDGILFEPGSARLAPPQQENAAALAKALAARPHISLAVRGGYDSEADTAALRGLALRRELVKRSGFRLRSGEDPGSVDPSDPRTRQAMETLYIEHGGTAMRMREIRRAAEGNERRYLRTLGEEISAKMPLPQDAGEALARDRAEAVRAALLVNGVAPERVRIGDLEAATAGENGVRTAVAFDAGQSAGSGR